MKINRSRTLSESAKESGHYRAAYEGVGPSTTGFSEPAPGCLSFADNAGQAIGGLYASRWCYQMRHHQEIGPPGCSIHLDVVTQGVLDLVGNSGTCDSSDLVGFATLIGTASGVPSGGGAKYNPVVDYNKDGSIDGTDLALFGAHLGHHCGQWQPIPSKPTMANYPWEVLDRPDFQAAMAKAGVDRQFIVDVWFENGPEQRLFVSNYDPEAHWAEVQTWEKPAPKMSSSWGNVKEIFR